MEATGIDTSGRRFTGVITTCLVAVAIMEMIAEYYRNVSAILIFKPMLMPLLALLYWQTSTRPNRLYLIGLFFCWISNIFFIWKEFDFIVAGAFMLFVYRIIDIYLVLRQVNRPGLFPLFVGSIPFFFMYLYLIYVANALLGQGLLIFILQCVLITFLGGVSVANHILQPSNSSLRLLVSTLFFALVQFIFVFREYYTSINFQPLAMGLFVSAQYLFYRFMLDGEVEPQKSEVWPQEEL